tara:strand:+ start:19586 stop:20608 length:1023 start_codon:yes stop_codon:yes gene_type:complete
MLAIWVMIFHLLDFPVIGKFAVFAFFVLSGFLMTMIMHETYGYGFQGLKNYVANRFLRLYPMYWAVAIFTVFVIYFVSEEYAFMYKAALQIPNDFYGVMTNVTMIFPALFPWDVVPRLSPPTWALTVEIFFYILIAVGVSKTKRSTEIWVGLSALYYIGSYGFGLNESHRYGSVFGASLPFSVGAAAYHYKNEIYRIIASTCFASSSFVMALYILNALICAILEYYGIKYSNYLVEIGKYFNILLSVFLLNLLFFKGFSFVNKKVDNFIGDFSYPIYLCHWQCGLVASFLIYGSALDQTRGLSLDWLVLVAIMTLGVSLFFIYMIDKKVSKLRDRIKLRG